MALVQQLSGSQQLLCQVMPMSSVCAFFICLLMLCSYFGQGFIHGWNRGCGALKMLHYSFKMSPGAFITNANKNVTRSSTCLLPEKCAHQPAITL